MPKRHPPRRRLQVPHFPSPPLPKAPSTNPPPSQGAALCHRAIEDLSTSVKNRIKAVVTYGDTRNQQDNGQIPNFPRDKVLVICNSGDAVCRGTLTILPAHLDYVRRVPEALAFFTQKVNAA
jgi:cutinase